MWQSLYAVINDALHSKRVWAAAVAILGLIGNEFFPQRIEMVLGVIGIVMAMIFGDSIRPIAKSAVVLLCLSGFAIAQDDYVEPIRNYANGLNIAKAERRPLMLFVTQKNCAPCKTAWRALNEMRDDRELGNCVVAEIDASTSEARALMVGKKLTPQVILLDLRNTDVNGAVQKHAIERVDRPEIQKLLSKLRPTR